MNDTLQASEPPSATSLNPWPGLASYTEQDSARFFGRENETTELLRLIERDTLTVLFGRSGLGKTSLLRAGIVPKLRESNVLPIFIRIDHSSNAPHPVEQAKAFAHQAAKAAGVEIVSTVELAADATLWEFFRAAEIWSPRNDLLTLLLVFDQFEEAFTIGRSAPRTREFLEQLADLAEDRVPRTVRERATKSRERLVLAGGAARHKVLLSLREDYVAQLDSLRPLMPAILRNRFALRALDAKAAAEVVLRAGREWVSEDVAHAVVRAVQGAQPEAEADAEILEQDGEIEPAYLSVMCHELFERMVATKSSAITLALVAEERGRILDALYERSFVGLDSGARLFVEDHLVTPSGFRSALPVSDAQRIGVSKGDLRTLVDRRLLRFEDRFGTRHVELSHDLLTRIVQASRDSRQARESRERDLQKAKRQADRLRRSRLQTGLAVSLFLAGAVVAAGYWLGFMQPSVKYYSDFERRWGVPVGIGEPLDEDTVHQRALTWRITRRGWRENAPVLTIEAVDSRENPTSVERPTYLTNSRSDAVATEEGCRWEYAYDRDGHVVREVQLDRSGRKVSALVFLYQDARSAAHPEATVTYVGPDGYPKPPGQSRTEYVRVTYDRKTGFEVEQRFLDVAREPVPGRDHAFGQRFSFDSQGHTTRIESIDRDGHLMVDSLGNAIEVSTYTLDSHGVVREKTDFYRDAAGDPIAIDGSASARLFYDESGNLIERRFFDIYGKPTRDREWGAHAVLFEYDSSGNKIRQRYLGVDGLPTRPEWPFHSEFRSSYDAKNKVASETYFDMPNHPVDGCSTVHTSYDGSGFESGFQWFDSKNEKCNPRGWLHEERFVKDSFDRVSEKAAYAADGTPTVIPYIGCQAIAYTRDERGHVLTETYVSKSKSNPDEACVNPLTGVHQIRHEYNRFGDEIAIEYFGLDDTRVRSMTQGFHRKEVQFDAFGPTEERYFDETQAPLSLHGYHKKVFQYDALGLLQDERTYDDSDGRVNDEKGIWHLSYEYDPQRRPSRERAFDSSDRTVIKDIKYEYNSAGLKSDERFEDTPDEDGSSHVHFEYDDRGQEVVAQHFDKNGRMLYATLSTYDALRALKTDERSVDAAGAPRADENGVSRTHYEYDDSDWLKLIQYFDAKGGPAANRYGMHEWKGQYDPSGMLRRETKLGVRGEGVLDRELGVATHVIEKSYPDARTSSESFLDVDGRLTLGEYGYARKADLAFSDGRKEMAFYDAEGHALLNRVWGYARMTTEPRGPRAWVERFFDADGNPAGAYGYAVRRYETDDRGRVIRQEFFDGAGLPTYAIQGYHRMEATFPESGRDVSYRYFDIDGSEQANADRVGIAYVYMLSQNSRAIRFGLEEGDVLWRFGNWSFTDTLRRARRETLPEGVNNRVVAEFNAAVARARTVTMAMTVIRRGKVLTLPVGPIGTDQEFGVEIKWRFLPNRAFEAFARRFP